MKTEITKWGNSQGVRIPKHLLVSAGISDRDTVEIVADRHSIVIRKAAKVRHKTIEERFAGFEGSHSPEAVEWGDPVGEEVW